MFVFVFRFTFFYGAGVFWFRLVYENVGQKNKHACWVLDLFGVEVGGFFSVVRNAWRCCGYMQVETFGYRELKGILVFWGVL